MDRFKNTESCNTKDIIFHLEKLQTDFHRLQIEHNKDYFLVKHLNSLIDRVLLIKNLVNEDPRFDWKIIQEEMDRLFGEDQSLTGYKIYFDFKKCKTPRRALLNIMINKKNQEDGIC